jgi:diguanylate cyclase (GGDEF)-like protein
MGSEVEQFHERLATADDRLRECAENPQRNTVEACLKDLIEATEEYVQQRDQACQRLHELAAEQPGGSASQGGLEQALDCEAQHIQAAGAAAQAFDYDADLRHGCRHIIDETSRLLDASHHVREALARTMVGQLHNNPELLDPQAERDTITGALNRVGLDNLLAQWLRNDPQHQRRLAAGLVDLDQFGRINTEYGQRLGDRVLRAAAQILQGECPGDGEVARLCSHTFVVLLPEADTRTAVDLIERARQTIEHARLEYRQTEIRVTASCAITEFRADDSPATFLMRLDATLMEAKRYGRNRSFVQEGEYPTPVIPPTLSVAERTIAL